MNPVSSISEVDSDLIIREALRHDIQDIMALVEPLYHYRRSEQFFIWQCFENIHPTILLVAEENHRIVGMYGIQKILTSNGLAGGQISWINIAKHKRGTGLFAEMGKRAHALFPELDFIFIFANHSAVHACERSLGLNFIGKLNRMILEDKNNQIFIGAKLEQIDSDTEFDIFNDRSGFIHFNHDNLYRKWRYAKSSEYKYFKITIDTGEYAIYKCFKENGATMPIVGDIVDFECDLRDAAKLEYLFRAACFHLDRVGAIAVSTWAVPGSPLRGILEKMNFIESDHASYFGIKVIRDNDFALHNIRAWHLVQADASNY
jgi:hypothetical protein